MLFPNLRSLLTSRKQSIESNILTIPVNEDPSLIEKLSNLNSISNYRSNTLLNSDTIFECKDLGYRYNNSKVVFKDISLKTFKDEIVAIVGPTGTGKSTLIRVLAHLVEPTSGHVYLNGHEINSPSSDISLIHQSIATFPWMTALDNVKVGLRSNKKISSHDVNQISIKMLDLVGLEGVKHMYPKEMSGDMRQKIAIARGLASSPSVLLMDEPFVHLDEFSANSLRREIHSIVFNPETSLKSVILVSHDLNEVVELADRVYVMREGNNPSSSATIVDEIKIDIQRPRSSRDPKFCSYVDKLYSDLDIDTV